MKKTRAERRDEVRAQRQVMQLQEQARSDLPGEFAEKMGGPNAHPVTVLQTAEEKREHAREVIAQLKGTGILPRGQLSEYTPEEGDAICAWVQAGGSMNGYCKKTGRPASTLYRWMRERADFHANYTRACEDRSDTLADDIIEIADDAAKDPTIEGVAAAKLRVEARKWIAAKLRPNKWGDKQVVEHQGNVSIRIGVPKKAIETTGEVVDVVGRMTGE